MIRILIVLLALPSVLWAAPPRVMTDIAPIHSLTAQVMGDLGSPGLLLPPGADPHDFALRPSDAQHVADADIIIWVGPGLTPWLEDLIATLSPSATRFSLLDTPDWAALPVREIGNHDDHTDEDHGDIDPHGWLDPATARVWTLAIADALSAADPDNVATYAENASKAIADLDTLDIEIGTSLRPLAGIGYVLPHDGYQYFEVRYGLSATAAIAGIDARDPGPAKIADLRDMMRADGITCIFTDAEIGESWANLVTEGIDARTAQIDGIGAGLTPGPELYGDMLRRLAQEFATCLGSGA